MNLALICCHFNPRGYAAPVANYHRFVEGLGPLAAHLTTVELVLDDDRPLPPAASEFNIVLCGRRPRHCLWQKERLLSIAIESLPPQYDAVCWLDADILFQNQDWYAQTIELLQRHPVVQPFRTGIWLDEDGNPGRERESICSAFLREGRSANGHPGFAWAARREIVEDGLLDRHITGGGDDIMRACWQGVWDSWNFRLVSPTMRRYSLRWGAKHYRRVREDMACVPGDVLHLYHGRIEHRNYSGRIRFLNTLRYDPERDVAVDDDGLLCWTGNNPRLQDRALRWFSERREDQ